MTRRSAFERGDAPIAIGADGAGLVREADVMRPHASMYGAPGPIGVAYYDFGAAPAPAAFLTFDLPPGTGEGVHRHATGDPAPGPFEEYYYVVSGEGAMVIEGITTPIRAGDMVRAPLGVAHGVFNTASAANLKVLVCFIARREELCASANPA